MHLCLFEDDRVSRLRPLVEMRAAYDVRLGLRTILETTRDSLDPDGLLLHVRPYLQELTAHRHPGATVNSIPNGLDVLFVNGRFVAHEGSALAALQNAPKDDGPRVYTSEGVLVAAWMPDAANQLAEDALKQTSLTPASFPEVSETVLDSAHLVEYPWDLLDTLLEALTRDVELHVGDAFPSVPLSQRPYADVHASVTSITPERIHLGDGASVKPGAVLDAHDGPIFIGSNVEIGEHAVVRGPCAVGRDGQVKIGANVEGTAAGPVCKIGGEVHDSILHSYTNKSHPGFLGHSYVGSWCNLGADTNNSNLRNDYATVSVYSPDAQRLLDTGRQFAGLFMGDHSKCGINTMFNTGTVIGTNCNVFGGGFPPRYVPPFSWGGPSGGFATYRFDEALSVAERMMERRDVALTAGEKAALTHVFEETDDERDAHHR